MARVRRGSLADIIDISDLDAAVNDLLAMNEQEFTRAVLLYLEGDRLGLEVMRDPDVIERTFDTIDRLLHRNRRRWQDGDRDPELSRLIESLDVERKAIRDEAVKARQARIREQEGKRAVEYHSRVNARLERALAQQRALRTEIERVQSRTPTARALERLKQAHLAEFLGYKREEREKDAEAERTRENGAGAADPPERSTAPAVSTQAAWAS